MKKVLSLAVVVLMLCGIFTVAASADSYNYNGPWELSFELKKADPANVIKDGVIGNGEYERLDVDTDPNSDNCQFWVGYSDSECFDYGEAMMQTVEYYFSWDETHGFNFAVRFQPHDMKQLLDIDKNGSVPGDYFLQNTGISLDLNSKNRTNSDWDGELYYAIARRTDTGDYLEGYYSQLGLKGSYNPEAGTDYIITYGADGYVTCEWSVALDNVLEGEIGAGRDVYFNISCTSGTRDSLDYSNIDFKGLYVVGLGNRSYYCTQNDNSTYAVATLTDTMLETSGNSDNGEGGIGGATDIITDGDSTGTGNGTTNNGNVTPVSGNGSTGSTTSTKTGDMTIILATVSAVSAAGAFISKKRRG